MRNLPVNWSEGMFLRPQHFQAADRHTQEVMHASEQWDHHFGYGIRSITISPDAISNSQFEVQELRARMRDGTLISAGPELNRLDLKGAFGKQETVRVMLAVPRRTSSGANVGDSTTDNPLRYSVNQIALPDDCSGGNDQDIELRRLNARLVDGTQELPGFELLPIAQVRRSGNGSVPVLDDAYIPPTIAVDGWTGLQRDYVRSVYDVIGTKIELVSSHVQRRGLMAHEPRDFERALLLRILNEAHAVLRNYAFVPGVHPFTAYTELCRIVGMLAILSPERRMEEIPVYDHDDLARIFNWARREISLLVDIVQESRVEIRYFEGECPGGSLPATSSGRYLKPRMRVSLEPQWLASNWDLYIGVRAEHVPRRVVRELLKPGYLDWKMGSSNDVERLFERRAEGLELRPLEDVPPELERSREWLYFEVSRGNSAWQAVFDSQSLAMRFNENLLEDPSAIDGQRKLVVKTRQETIVLEIALLAVPATRPA